MKNLPLNALRAFAAVYEAGGVRAAARQLDITHSSVSRHISELEARLGAPLLEPQKGRQPLKLTPQGEKLGRDSLKHLTALQASLDSVREIKTGNTVTIATTPSIAARWLLPRLARFHEEHPAIEVSVTAEQRLAAPAEEKADFNIRMGKGPWKGLDCIPLMDDSLFPVIGRHYWEEVKRDFRLEDCRILHDRDPQAGWAAWTAFHGPEDARMKKGPRYASSDLVLRAAAQNQGIALARGRLAEEELANGSLIRPLGEMEIRLADAYWIVKSPGIPIRKAVQILMDWLQPAPSAQPVPSARP